MTQSVDWLTFDSVLVLLDPVDEGTTILETSLTFTSQHGVMS